MQVLVTGSRGFIGKNLLVHMTELEMFSVLEYSRDNTLDDLQGLVDQCDAIVHLAGENRPDDVSAFNQVNAGFTALLCDAIRKTGRKIPLLLASSIQADQDNPYGKSKLAAEKLVEQLHQETGNPGYIYRLPNVFGKWCKPNYNSVVATFCYNITQDLPIQINEPAMRLRLVYVDDVIQHFLSVLKNVIDGIHRAEIEPEYSTTLGKLAVQIKAFKHSRDSLVSEAVGTGLVRALYSTYVSYLRPEQFSYPLHRHGDERGVFVEMLKTKNSGQFSFFTAHPGVTRGGHYHHTKTEKFLVIKGVARFCFRNMVTNETYEIFAQGNEPQVVDTVPGWTHDITNIGDDEMIVMLWANEIFDRDNPDTIVAKV